MMDYLYMILIVATSHCVMSSQKFPTKSDLEDAKTEINQIIDDNAEGNNNLDYPFIAGFVRLSFHDCVGPDNCDGCIDHDLDDNKGLKIYTDSLDVVYLNDVNINTKMSRADFYAFAAYVALERASAGLSDEFKGLDNFKVGRIDCAASPVEDKAPTNAFPKGIQNLPKLVEFFDNEFGFTEDDTVAILGAHTLGRCHHASSGFEGKWVKGRVNGKAKSDMLDNDYYKQIRGNWTQVQVQSGKFQWQRPDTDPNTEDDGNNQPNMFLNADIAIAWDLETDDEQIGENGTVACVVEVNGSNCIAGEDCCDRASSNTGPLANNLFRTYVSNGTRWMEDFEDVFHRMTHDNEIETLQLPTV